MKRITSLLFVLLLFVLQNLYSQTLQKADGQSPGTLEVLWDNGPFITHVGTGSSGSDWSMLQDESLGMTKFGFSTTDYPNTGWSLCDDFTVTGLWDVETITFFVMMSQSNFTQMHIEQAYLEILSDTANGGAVIYGDMITNRLLSTDTTGFHVWRHYESNPSWNGHLVAKVRADVSELYLTEGTYWVRFRINGYYPGVSHSVWAIPVTILGETTTGNAFGWSSQSGIWTPLMDVGQQGIAFVIEGAENSASILDAGITDIISPASGINLSTTETITFIIKNFGEETIDNIPYEITWEGPSGSNTITGTYTGSIESGMSAEITLTETADLSVLGEYIFKVCTKLEEDAFPDNDCWTENIQNDPPFPCTENLYTDGCSSSDILSIKNWNFANVTDLELTCQGMYPTWYTNLTDTLTHELVAGKTYTLYGETGEINVHFDIWIDENNDAIYSYDTITLNNEELILNNGIGSASYEFLYDIRIPAYTPGLHHMRMRSRYGWADAYTRFKQREGYVVDACETYDKGCCVDFRVNIVQPIKDVGVESVNMLGFYKPESIVTPRAKVANYSSTEQSFEVTMTIGSYSSTQTVSGLAYGSKEVTFDDWEATEGNNTVMVCTSLDNDENSENNCMGMTVDVHDGNIAFAFCSSTNPEYDQHTLAFDMDDPEATLSALTPTQLPCGYDGHRISGGCWANKKWWACSNGGDIYTIEHKTGEMILIGQNPDVGYQPWGSCFYAMAFDGHTMFACSENKLYSIDTTNGVSAFIGEMQTGWDPAGWGLQYKVMAGLACNKEGILYGITSGGGGSFGFGVHLWKIDKTNADVIDIGEVVYLSGFMDLTFDKNTDICYITGYDNDLTALSVLLTVDVQTCEFNVINYWSDDNHLTGFVIPYDLLVGIPEPAVNDDKASLSVFPNPSDGEISISVVDLSEIKVFASDAQLVYERQYNEQSDQTIKINNLPAGIYLVKAITSLGYSICRKAIVR